MNNALYYGDNLDVLRRYIDDESVDLVYLDPPFQSARNYNVLFSSQDGERAPAQIKAFEDTWRWDQAAARDFHRTVEAGGEVSRALQAFRTVVGENDMLAYLSMMAPRLVELRRVMKPTASIYLHCDPTASHYLKVLMDAVFGPERFGSEIVWKRSTAHSDTKQGRKLHGHIHDTILFYTKSDDWTWNPVYQAYDQEYVDSKYSRKDESGRRYRLDNLTAAKPGGDTEYLWRVKRKGEGPWMPDLDDEHQRPKAGWEYQGVPPYRNRYWAYSLGNMKEFARTGHIRHTRSGMPEYKRFLDEMPGVALQDVWTDINPINSQAAERLGYPTQKPQALLERIIQCSSNPGDTVLDPFCGCGTTVAAAQALGRRWLGIDITHLAINLIRHRLRDQYGEDVKDQFEVIGEPVSLDGARELAEGGDRHQFELWALGLVGARPVEGKKGADRGIDGRLYFHEGEGSGTKQVIISVKSGKTGVAHVRDLVGVIDRESAQLGVLLTLQEPTRPMREEAASAGLYSSPWGDHHRIQILTIEDLLDGGRIDMPRTAGTNVTLRRAPKQERKDAEQLELGKGG